MTESTYAWQIGYRYDFADHYSWSVAWINEGHFPLDHRDGVAGQLWVRVPLPNDRLAIQLGAGAYHLFNTHELGHGDSVIERAWAPILSASATYSFDTGWFVRLAYNAILPQREFSTNQVLLGMGYWLGETDPDDGTIGSEPARARPARNELTIAGGRTVVNAAVGDSSFAQQIEYRRMLSRRMEWTLAWLNEGDPKVAERDGITSQLWLRGAFFEERLTLGIGAGGYYNVDRARRRPADDGERLMALVSPTFAYGFGDRWLARFTWHRVISDNHRDADVFLLGVGRRW